MLRTLREPRYLTLTVVMVIVALGCIAAGTWQIAREAQKHQANAELRDNAHAPTTMVASVLPLVGGATPASHQIQYRTVTLSGSYDAAGQVLVRQRTVNDDTGYLVLTPLRSAEGIVLVVRGFVSGTHSESVSAPPPPTGSVTVTGRVQPAETRDDAVRTLPAGQVESINPPEQARRLGAPVRNGYVELLDGQSGTDGLTPIPAPDLSNPAGGAVEPQHVAYIVQWYLFAALALAAPFVMARAERRRDTRELGEESAPVPATDTAARMADRYGRPVR